MLAFEHFSTLKQSILNEPWYKDERDTHSSKFCPKGLYHLLFRRSQNCAKKITERGILRTLVKSDTYVRDGIDGHVSKDVGFYPCLKCAACKNVRKRCFEFRSCITDRTYKIKQLVTCASTNVIYLLSCPCIKQYVGKTNRQFRTRIIEHMSAIRRKDLKSLVARHFVDVSFSFISKFCCYWKVDRLVEEGV